MIIYCCGATVLYGVRDILQHFTLKKKKKTFIIYSLLSDHGNGRERKIEVT